MTVLIIGSGPSGLQVALSALERDRPVTMIDVGFSGADVPLPEESYTTLKDRLPDPVGYFLGEDCRGAEIPAPSGQDGGEYYRLPPSKDHVFRPARPFRLHLDGLTPLVSFASGGLAECWTAGAYPFNDDDLAEFPFGYDDLAPHYAKVAERIGVAGEADDLARFLPAHDNLAAPIALDASSQALLRRYDRRRARLNTHHAARLGRSRQAALSAPLGDRGGCTQCGRCLWGCPTGALYTPSITLRDCLKNPLFTYVPGQYASHFTVGDDGDLNGLVTLPCDGGAAQNHRGEAFVLACGTLNSSAIFLRTIWTQRKEIVRLGGLMDNRQVLAPFLNLSMLGRPLDPASYQYHQLATGLPQDNPAHYVHGQITMFSSGAMHPLIQQLPLALRPAGRIMAEIRSGLGVLNLNFHDERRPTNYLTLDPADDAQQPALKIHYRPRAQEADAIGGAMKSMRRFFRDLGAPIIPGMTRLRPMGSSVHYAGTLPMSREAREFTVSPDGQSRDFANLYVVDGSVLPFLPAKNLTFTLMANATRIASRIF